MAEGSVIFRNSPREPGVDIFMASGQQSAAFRIFDPLGNLLDSLPSAGGIGGEVTTTPASNAANTIQPTGDAIIPLTLKGHSASQNAALLQLLKSDGTQLSFFDSKSNLTLQPSGDLAGTPIFQVIDSISSSNALIVRNSGGVSARSVEVAACADTDVGFTIFGNSPGQSGDLLAVRSGAGTVLSRIKFDGSIVIGQGAGAGGRDLFNALVGVGAQFSTTVTFQGNATILGGGGGFVQILDGANVALQSTTGTQFGTATTQKLAFYGATPIVQPAATTDLRTVLINLGFLASGGASPLNLNGGALTCGGITILDGTNITLQSTTGTQIGTATTQKLAFYGATPIVQPAATTDLRTLLINLGLLTSGGASPLNLNGGALTCGGITIADGSNITLQSTTGTQIGTAATQKLAFYGATPIVQPAATTDLLASLTSLGLMAGGATPLNLNGGAFASGSANVGALTNTTITSSDLWTQTFTDSATSVESIAYLITHKSTLTPVAGFGTQIQFGGDSSTNTNRRMGTVGVEWTVPTDGSTVSEIKLQAAKAGAFVPVLTGDGNQLVVIPGSFQVGSGAAANNELIYLSDTTALSASVNAARILIFANPSGNPGSVTYTGGRFDANVASGNTQSFASANVFGVSGQANHRGTGTLSLLAGGSFVCDTLSTGSCAEIDALRTNITLAGTANANTDCYGLRVTVPIYAGGSTANRMFGISIDDQSSASNVAHSTGLLIRKINTANVLNTVIESQGGGSALWEAGTDATIVHEIRQNSGAQTGALMRFMDVTGATLLAQFDSGANLQFADAKNVIVGTTTGTKIGTATSQKLGFFNSAPVVQQANASQATINAVIDASAKAALQSIYNALSNLGLCAATA